ncbi:MAG: undecaprenyl-diphosphate phosphatase [Brockia lithotrophica]|nr:undecaprenyl-diphosphate phosphatase [Brockia lithotrophica]
MRLALWQVILFAVLQGITELFPVSSVAHAVLLPAILHWNITKEGLLPFTVMLHLGTAFALFFFFWPEWRDLILAVISPGRWQTAEGKRMLRLLLRLVVATVPAAAIGFLFEKALSLHFPSGTSAAFFLMVNGLVLILSDRWRALAVEKSRGISGREILDEEIVRLSYGKSTLIGLAQSLALIPGFSRSGMTMVAGIFAGLSYEAAARFSFLLATPIILGAGILEVPKLLHADLNHLLVPAILGGISAGIAATVSVWVLMRYFHAHEVKAFRPFGIYCILAGLFALAYLTFGG